MNRAQTDEQMNMILDSTDFFGDTTQVFNNATQICVQTAAPVWFNIATRFLVLKTT